MIATRNESNEKVDRATRYKEITDLLKINPQGLTARQIAYGLGFRERNATAPRLTELVKKGLVIEDGTRWDEFTKRNVAVYKLKG